jgi:UDP-glucose 4-epimerase
MSGRVLVTGGAGFIGSHIAEAYLSEGWEVVVLDDLSRGHEQNVPKAARFICADIRSPEARRLLATGKFDALNHHAAQIDVRVSVDQPAFDAGINIVGFVNLLEGAGEGGVKRVVFASSGGVVYGDPAVIPTPETGPKLPVSPYGVS